jgi:hypothetical protein
LPIAVRGLHCEIKVLRARIDGVSTARCRINSGSYAVDPNNLRRH